MDEALVGIFADETEKLTFDIEETGSSEENSSELLALIDSRFNAMQKRSLMSILKHGLSKEEFAKVADPKFDETQMRELARASKSSKDSRKFDVMLDERFSAEKINQLRLGIVHELDIGELGLIANPEFTADQMREIRRGLEEGLPVEQVALYADPDFDADRMAAYKRAIREKVAFPRIIERRYSIKQVNTVLLGKDYGLDITDLVNGMSDSQLEEIASGVINNLSYENLALYARPDLTAAQMRELRWGLIDGVAGKDLLPTIHPELTPEEIRVIVNILKKGIRFGDSPTPRTLRARISEESFDWDSLETWTLSDYEAVGIEEDVALAVRHVLKANPSRKALLVDMLQHNMNSQQIRAVCAGVDAGAGSAFVETCMHKELSIPKITVLREAFLQGLDLSGLDAVGTSLLKLDTIRAVDKRYRNELQAEERNIIDLFAELNENQINELHEAASNNLSWTVIQAMCFKDLDEWQMREVRLAAQSGVPDEQIVTFTDPKMPWQQMYTARVALRVATDVHELETSCIAGKHVKAHDSAD